MKILINLFLLLMLSCSSYSQEIRVVLDKSDSTDLIAELSYVLNGDTTKLSQMGDNQFLVTDDFFDGQVMVSVNSYLFELGEIQASTKSIFISLVDEANQSCYVVHRSYNDVIQSDLKATERCDLFHEIIISDVLYPEKNAEPVINLRKNK